GLAPFPGAWMEVPAGKRMERVKVHESALGEGKGAPGTVLAGPDLTIACGKGAVRLIRLQKAGGKPLSAEDFLRGTPLAPATVLA
ncbi:MAG: methionyl-tRNA formyltransferase, partial [Rhizobiaceae bacterium]|nr:methionyl-tRNA formyltransferase [Rhizobiaceae bacterium]